MTNLVLTPEFDEALTLLHGGHNLFLTGKAGTGKSTLVRLFHEQTQRRVIVAAPTGIAALNVDGYTIHRLFSFHPTMSVEQVRTGAYYPGAFGQALKNVDTLIIDEISMVRADLFDMLVAALERFGPHPGRRFGGVQLVLVGDLMQLPPVVTEHEREFFNTRYTTPYFFSADTFRRPEFPTVALTTVFRQLGDQRMTSMLNAIREGLFLDQAQADLNARTNPDFSPPDEELWLTLAPTNRIVAVRNREKLAELPTELVRYTAQVSGDISNFDAPTDEVLEFKIGAQIMMLTNDFAGRWVNGTLGKIAAIDHRGGDIVVRAEFRDGTQAEITPHLWEATQPTVVGGALRHEPVGTFRQLPFKLAWAITIHKSQGQTVDRLFVDLTGGVFDFGQLYVALSRCTSLEGLVLKRPVLAKDLRTDRRVHRFLAQTTRSEGPQRFCALAANFIGAEDRMSRPRPVEIAIAFEDGTEVTTLINPQRDLGEARAQFGIATHDVLLAPTLAQVWPVLLTLMDGATPVGMDVDHVLGLLDFELKRLGMAAAFPLGVELRDAAMLPWEQEILTSGSALERARQAVGVRSRLGITDAAAGTFAAEGVGESAFLLLRDFETRIPRLPHDPTLSGLLMTSWALSLILAGGHKGAAVAQMMPVNDPTLVSVVQNRLRAAIENSAGLPALLLDRVREVEVLLGTKIHVGAAAGSEDISAVLVPGARVCFTGSVIDPQGAAFTKSELEALIIDSGLVWSANVTKTRCDVLIVAEMGTQSGKARKAKEYGKPVFSAADFFAWTQAR